MKKMAVMLVFFFFCCTSAQINADLILTNGKIYTVNKNFEIAEAMVILKGKILAVGNSGEMLRKYKASKTLDLKGKTVFPGLIDAHCHFTGYATDHWKAQLYGTKSWEEIILKITDYAKAAPRAWIYGRGWDQNDWAEKEFPTKDKLDLLFPDRPVYLKRIDGHAALANQRALDIARITINTKISGGEIEIKNNRLSGILIDNAMSLVEKKIPEIEDDLAIQYYADVQKECFSYGLTSLHDCGISEKTLALLEKAQSRNLLKMKIFALLEDDPKYYDRWIKKGRYTNNNITVGGFKVYADGALGSRGANLLQDYTDKKGWKGFLLSEEVHFTSLAQKLKNSNLQMCTHAIGDAANRTILQTYGAVLGEKNDRRWRIEHAQVIDERDFHLFKKYSIIPSVQPTHATSDMYWAEERLGKARLKTSYAYRQLLGQNGWMPLGTDFPVEEINPFRTFYAAVVRKDSSQFPAGGFQKENALSREQALRGMTIWAAKSAFQESETGSLETGKWADFIILNQDLMKVSEDKILETKVLETYSNGQKVF